jgi:hypothetical protein
MGIVNTIKDVIFITPWIITLAIFGTITLILFLFLFIWSNLIFIIEEKILWKRKIQRN